MSYSMTSFLVHNEGVPTEAREALKSASAAPPERRHALLLSAARVIHGQTDLECEDVRELIGLPAGGGCG
jgi:hypothetical protein